MVNSCSPLAKGKRHGKEWVRAGGTAPNENNHAALFSVGLAMLALLPIDLGLAVSTRAGNLVKRTFNSPSRYEPMNRIHLNGSKTKRSRLTFVGMLFCILVLGAVGRSTAGDYDGVGGYRMPLKPDSHMSGGTGNGPNEQGNLDPSSGRRIGVDQDATLGQPECLAVRLTIRVSYVWFKMTVFLR